MNEQTPAISTYGFSETKLPYVVCAKTREYRESIAKVCRPDDVVLEVGSAHGVTLANISKFSKKAIGIDKGESEVAIARCRYPNLEFHVLDANDIERIRQLGKFSLIYVDVSGVVDLTTLLSILLKLEKLKPRLFVVKSLELKKLSCKIKNGDVLCSSVPQTYKESQKQIFSQNLRGFATGKFDQMEREILEIAAKDKIDMKIITSVRCPFDGPKIPRCHEKRAELCHIAPNELIKCVYLSFYPSHASADPFLFQCILPSWAKLNLETLEVAVTKVWAEEFLESYAWTTKEIIKHPKEQQEVQNSRLQLATPAQLKKAGLEKECLTYGIFPPFGTGLSKQNKLHGNQNQEGTNLIPAADFSDTQPSQRSSVCHDETKESRTREGKYISPFPTFICSKLCTMAFKDRLKFELNFGKYIELSFFSLKQATCGFIVSMSEGTKPVRPPHLSDGSSRGVMSPLHYDSFDSIFNIESREITQNLVFSEKVFQELGIEQNSCVQSSSERMFQEPTIEEQRRVQISNEHKPQAQNKKNNPFNILSKRTKISCIVVGGALLSFLIFRAK